MHFVIYRNEYRLLTAAFLPMRLIYTAEIETLRVFTGYHTAVFISAPISGRVSTNAQGKEQLCLGQLSTLGLEMY